MNKKLKLFAVCGIIGPILYAATVVIGGLLRPGYSHVAQAVSELIEVGAPNKLLLDMMFFVYSVLLIVLAFGLHRGINNGKGSKVGPVLLFLVGVLGLLMTIFFPLDAGGRFVTFTGIMHVVLAVPLFFFSIFAVLAFWRRLKSDSRWSGYGVYSLVTFIVALVIGGMSSVLAGSPFLGLVERLTIGTFLQWNGVMAVKLLRLSI